MTREKILQVVQIYRTEFQRQGIRKEELPKELYDSYASGQILKEHCHWMLDSIEQWARGDRRKKEFQKAHVWLGFVQGCCSALRIFTINQMRNQNRPKATS